MNKMKTIQRQLQTVKREFNANLTEFNNNWTQTRTRLTTQVASSAEQCRELNASIVSLGDDVKRYHRPGWNKNDLWIGAKRVNGVWKWMRKSRGLADSLYWSPGEPNYSHENCVETSANFIYHANNRQCDQFEHFVCEKLT
ncbi:perlucin-like [Watersipora subatra]|uniref:perlucin-like n=1 Tax=Watersipora subatra TaxID=2589382 RepID=UPI00355B7CB8